MKCFKYKNWTDANNLQVLSDEISKKQKVRETIPIPGLYPYFNISLLRFSLFAFVERLTDQVLCLSIFRLQKRRKLKSMSPGVDIIL